MKEDCIPKRVLKRKDKCWKTNKKMDSPKNILMGTERDISPKP
jgi:hypothetical protein